MKKSKYSNIKTTIDGIKFDSKREAEYYCELKILKKGKVVKDFELQPKFELQTKFKKNGTSHRAINYVADFKVEYTNGTVEIIDIKGMETEVFKIKRKLFEFAYPNLELKIIK